jgi:Protein of unknown function (DUF2505)
MHFRVEQRIRGELDAVAAAFTDPAYYALLDDLPKLGRPNVLDRREDGATVHLRIRYRFAGQLSAAARAVLDPAKLTWVEESTHDLDAHEVTFRLVPDHYGDRFRCRGKYQLIDSGAGFTQRIAEGDLSVSTPFVGRLVEQAIVSGLKEHLADEVPVVERFVAPHTEPG